MSRLGVIFDWDGVVVDSSRLHELSWDRLAQELGFPPPAVSGIGSLGMKTQAVISDLLGWTKDPAEIVRLTNEKEAMFRRLAREGRLDPIPGVLDFLTSLKSLGVGAAVGSSAPRDNIEAGLDVLKARDRFAAIVCGDDVIHGKPAPDIFLKAAERLECAPADCVVFEDAPAGVAAARAAGMNVIGVLTAYSKTQLGNADRFVRDFRDVSAAEVVEWLSARRAQPADAAR